MVKKRQVPAGVFKAKCLALLDEVASTGQPLVVTKRGRPVAEVVPVEPPSSLEGSVIFNVDDDELIEPIDVDWEALR